MGSKHVFKAAGAALCALAPLPASALTLTVEAAGVTTSQVVGATLFHDFDGTDDNAVGSFNAAAANGGANPGAGGNWFTVGDSFSSADLTMSVAASYLGFFWGSTDDYNMVEVYDGSTLLATYFGQPDVTSGFQGSRYVNLAAGPGQQITRLAFSSRFAFEMDNFSYIAATTSEVPIPAALPLFGSAVGGAGLFRWMTRRRQVSAGS